MFSLQARVNQHTFISVCRSTARLQHFCIDVRARSSGQYYISNPQTNSIKHFVLKVAPLWMWSHWRMDSSRCFLILRSWDFFSSSVAVNTNWTVSLVPRGSAEPVSVCVCAKTDHWCVCAQTCLQVLYCQMCSIMYLKTVQKYLILFLLHFFYFFFFSHVLYWNV